MMQFDLNAPNDLDSFIKKLNLCPKAKCQGMGFLTRGKERKRQQRAHSNPPPPKRSRGTEREREIDSLRFQYLSRLNLTSGVSALPSRRTTIETEVSVFSSDGTA